MIRVCVGELRAPSSQRLRWHCRAYATGASKQATGSNRKTSALKGASASSTTWLRRQLSDPFVKAAHSEGYRSRSAFKLIQIDDKFRLLKPGATVVDLGACPGGWTQVAVERVRSRETPHLLSESTRLSPAGPRDSAGSYDASAAQNDTSPPGTPIVSPPSSARAHAKSRKGMVVSVDLQEMEAVDGAIVISGRDFTLSSTQKLVLEALGGVRPMLVMSDMAPNAAGLGDVNHLATHHLVSSALRFALRTLANGGSFVCKHFHGEKIPEFRNLLRKHFETVKDAKPEASHKDSSEFYLVARGFKAPPPDEQMQQQQKQ